MHTPPTPATHPNNTVKRRRPAGRSPWHRARCTRTHPLYATLPPQMTESPALCYKAPHNTNSEAIA